MSQDVYVIVEHLKGQVADISYVMLAAARNASQATGGQVVAVLLGHSAEALAADLSADKVLYVDHPLLEEFTPDSYRLALAPLIEAHQPRVVFFGDTSIGADVAGGLSAKLGWPLVSYCRSVAAGGADLGYSCQICGGKIMAEGEVPGPSAIITMIPGAYKPDEGRSTAAPSVEHVDVPTLDEGRVSLGRYIEPEAGDVDITREAFLVAIGRGIQNEDNIELAQDLADALGGAVCASRPVVDQGWLPTTRLVGKSGLRVSPKIYLAMGISGAPEHTESITDSELVVAVNTDPAAPIFDMAKYGAEVDMLDLLPELIEMVQEAKGG